MRLYNSLTNSNSYTTEKVLHADMQLSSRSNDCWSSCILSAMDGLTQSCIYRQKLRNCEPIDPSHFVVDLREIHLEYWTTYSDTHLREHNSKRSTYHRWRALPTKRALVTHLPYILSNYTFLNLPLRDVIRSTARFRLRVHTLRFETATWNQSDPPPLTCVMLMMCKMSSMFFSTALSDPHVITLRRKYAPLFPPTGTHDVLLS